MSRRPYKSEAREAAAGETRARLIAATRSLLSEEPYVPFSLEAVAKKAGVTRLTVYHQFGARRALMEAVFDELAGQSGLMARLGAAAAEPDPHAGIARVVEVFCDFWSSDSVAYSRLSGAMAMDPELAEGVHDRNERRRTLLTGIVGRLAAIRPEAARDLVDILFAVTGFQMWVELARDRDAEAVRALVQAMAEDAVRRASAADNP